MKHILQKLIKNSGGVAFVEFALVFPFMVLLLFGGIEVTRYILIVQKLEKAAYVITDIVGQYSAATEFSTATDGSIRADKIDDEVLGVGNPQNSVMHRLMGVFGETAREGVIITGVTRNRTGAVLMRWQRRELGAEVAGATSIVNGATPQMTTGDACFPAPFPGDAALTGVEIATQLTTMNVGESMVVGEVFFLYEPLITFTGIPGLTARRLDRRLFIHPRNGELQDLPPAHPVKLDTPTNTQWPCG